MFAEPEFRRRQGSSGKELRQQRFRGRDFAVFEPVYIVTFAFDLTEKYVLALGKLSYAVEQSCPHFLKRTEILAVA